MKGEGDGERNAILLMPLEEILNFCILSSNAGLRKALIGGETSLVLSPDSDFFKFFGKSIKPAVKDKIRKFCERTNYCGRHFFYRRSFPCHFPVKNQKYA